MQSNDSFIALIHALNEVLYNKDLITKPISKHKSPKLTNCKNCGAPLHSNKCEFCDTEYDW